MDLNLHQLRIFQTVAKHLSYSRAAQEMTISQPSVSMQVKALERAIGLRLFEQIGKRIFLTDPGRELFGYCQRVFALLDETVQVLEDLKGVRRGNLRVVATTTVGIYVVPRALGIFHRLHPEVKVSLDVVNWSEAHGRVVQNEVDFAIAGQIGPETPELVVEPFMSNELVVIASRRHPLRKRGRIPLEALRNETWLVREQGSGTRAAMEKLFADRALEIGTAMELSRNGAIKQAVAADLGVAVLSKQACLIELENGTLTTLDVEGFPILRSWHIVHLRDKHQTAIACAFKDFLRAYRHDEGPVPRLGEGEMRQPFE